MPIEHCMGQTSLLLLAVVQVPFVESDISVLISLLCIL